MELRQLEKIVRKSGPITHFCYAFAKILQQKLEELVSEGIFTRSGTKQGSYDTWIAKRNLGITIARQLERQIDDEQQSEYTDDQVCELVERAAAFLELFEEEEEDDELDI